MKYCLHCDWYASSTDGVDEHERSQAAIDHFVETGHSINSVTAHIGPEVGSDHQPAGGEATRASATFQDDD